jgi:hypothetical protein
MRLGMKIFMILYLGHMIGTHAARGQNSPFIQAGISVGLSESDVFAQDLVVGYTLKKPDLQHNFSVIVEHATEQENKFWSTGGRYGIDLPISSKWDVNLSAEAKWDVSRPSHDLTLEENLQFGYKITEQISLQAGGACSSARRTNLKKYHPNSIHLLTINSDHGYNR